MEQLKALRVQRTLGATFIPLEVYSHLSSLSDNKERKEELKLKWRESGMLHGNYLKERFEDPIHAFKTFLEATRWDLNEVKLENEGKRMKLRIASTTLTGEETSLLLEYMKAALNGIGLEIQSCNHMRGLIIIEAEKPS